MGRLKPKRPSVGENVIVWWLDSGAGETTLPGGTRELHVNETHGKVVSLGKDDRLKGSFPAGSPKTSSETLVLAMDSSGPTDERSDMAIIWWPSVLRLKVCL